MTRHMIIKNFISYIYLLILVPVIGLANERDVKLIVY
jgi:hypothetical protein